MKSMLLHVATVMQMYSYVANSYWVTLPIVLIIKGVKCILSAS